MHYVSTRGGSGRRRFEEVLLAGLAEDGGLFVPEAWPRWTRADFEGLRGCDYPTTAAAVLRPFVADAFDPSELAELCRAAYANFAHAATAPLVQLAADDWLLELFHGPTLAFKDFALQILARMFESVLARRGGRLTIVAATSGDTGSAAIHAVAGRRQMAIVVLHPHGRISPVQRRQMTTVDAANVLNLAIEGTFDDCQALLKALFADADLRAELGLAAINSINWARIAAQAAYYVYAALRLGGLERPPIFAVPTGNFGDVYAGHVARHLGLPVRRLIVATNRNDILARFFTTGIYARGEVVPTRSPSMDIQVASNFERLLFELGGHDPGRVREWMRRFADSGHIRIDEAILRQLACLWAGGTADEAETLATMSAVYAQTGEIVDPHTAVGIAVGRRLRQPGEGPLVCLATAHPAKFPHAVREAIGREPPVPPRLAQMTERTERFEVLPAELPRLRERIRAFATGRG
ncbi:Threonine synthase [bacterium HR40]|nr:Threonine synthase [bacterium HR40]